MKIGIVGASGLIGRNLFSHLREHGLNCLGTYVSKPQPELIKFSLLEDDGGIFSGCTHVVIAGGVTNLDLCLREPDLARKINVSGTVHLINRLTERGIKAVFLSSDQVFDGIRGNYSEEDSANPVNHYGQFKLDVETYLNRNVADYLVLRLSKTYSRNEKDGGLFWDIARPLREGKRIKAAYNQIYNPTDVHLVCDGIRWVIDLDLRGIYHLASPQALSRYDFAVSVARELGLDEGLIERVDFTSLPLMARRALNSSLNVTRWMGVAERIKRL